MRTDIEIDLLRSFAAVADTRNFTRAAERLGCAQSAVSGKIKRLEETIGVQLFRRTKRVVSLTPDGIAFTRYASQMIRLNDEILCTFAGAAPGGSVRLGATDTSIAYLPPVLSDFGRGYPLIEVELRCDRSWTALDALEAGEVDLALVTQVCGREHGIPMRREALVWAVAAGAALEHVEPLPLAIFGPGCIYREAALAALDAIGRRWRLAYTSVSRDGLEAAVQSGHAVTIVPESGLTPGLRRLGAEQGLPPLPDMELFLFKASAPRSDAVEALLRSIETTLGNLPRGRIVG